MPSWFVNKRQQRPFSLAFIALFSVGITLSLYLLSLDDVRFDALFDSRPADAVSIAYLEQQVRSAPRRWYLRLKLAAQLQATGQFAAAWHTLQPLQTMQLPDQAALRVALLTAEVMAQQGFAAATAEVRHHWVEQARQRLQTTDWTASDTAELVRLATLALSLEAPEQATQFYFKLARVDSDRRHHWLAQSARWLLASQQEDKAGRLYARMAPLAPTPSIRTQNQLQAVAVFLGQGLYADAFSTVQQAIGTHSTDSDLLFKGVELAQQMADQDHGRQWLAQLLALDLDTAALAKVQTLALGLGNVDQALAAAERRLPYEPANATLHGDLAQLYEWNSQPAQALTHWLWLSHADGAKNHGQAMYKSWTLAQTLFMHQTVIDVLTRVQPNRPLKRLESQALVAAWNDQGQPDQAIHFLRQHLRQTPDDSPSWLLLIQLLEDQEKLKELADTWQALHRRQAISHTDFMRYVQVLQKLGRLDDAIQLLQQTTLPRSTDGQTPSHDTHDRSEYWSLLAELAWKTENDAVAATAVAHQLAIAPRDLANIDRYLALENAFTPQQRFRKAQQAFAVYPRPYYGFVAMELAAQLGYWNALTAIIQRARRYATINNTAPYWLAMARLLTQQRAITQAITAYEQALQYTGLSRSLVASYLWLLINEDQQAILKTKLTQWQGIARDEPRLWSVFAAGYRALHDYPSALAWYQQALQQQPHNAMLIMDYADTLALSGDPVAAWRWRQSVQATLLDPATLANPLTWPYSLQTRTRAFGLANSLQWLQQTGPRHSPSWPTTLAALLMDAGNMTAATAWLTQAQTPVPLYQRFAVALQGDGEALEPLLTELNRLAPGPDDISAVRMTGRTGTALALALPAINADQPEDSRRQLTEQATAMTVAYPAGWRMGTQLNSDNTLSTQGHDATLAQRFNRLHLQLDSQGLRYRHDDETIRNPLGCQWRYRLQVTWPTLQGDWQGYLDTAQRTDSDRVGGGLMWSLRSDRWSNRWFLGLQEQPEVTALMAAFGQQSRLGADGNYRISNSDQVALSAEYLDFRDRYQHQRLGTGYRLQSRWQHQVLYRDPEWFLSVGVDWQHYRVANTLSSVLADQLVTGAAPSLLLPEQYRFYYLSSRWQHGEPGALNARVPSPRWLVNITVGMREPDSSFSYSLRTGLGWQVLGNDELSLTAVYNSNPQGATSSEGYQLNLSYQYRFGR